MRNWLAYLLNGSDEMTMSRAWLREIDPETGRLRLEEYEAYTARENASAYVSRDSKWFRNKDFWDARAEREKPKLRIVRAGER